MLRTPADKLLAISALLSAAILGARLAAKF